MSLADIIDDHARVPFVFYTSIVVIAFLFSAAVCVIFGYFSGTESDLLDSIKTQGRRT